MAFGVGLALLVAEICLRLFFPQDLIRPQGVQLDQEIIYTLKPNTEAHFKGTSVRMYHLKTNSVGIRERETSFHKPNHVFRILLLGDSISMGEGVEFEETYLKQLELLLEAAHIKGVETINAAIRGYGNDQELILFRRIGKRYEPDLVILAFFVYNDMEDNWEAQLFKLKKGKLVQQPATVEMSKKYRNYVINSRVQNRPGYRFLMSHSHAANWLRVTYSTLLRRSADREERAKKDQHKVPLEKQPAFHLTLAILEAWDREVKEIGARPFLLILPARSQMRSLRAMPDADTPRLDLALEKFCEREGISFSNLSQSLLKWQGDFESLWLADGHLSPEGHVWVARELFGALRSKGLLKMIPVNGKRGEKR
ncbi:MAG: hypothetical protein HY590_01795 [Candidatus Omnitrophica bacterium]|nr:hypothetical protein [Candidatus Omnitrophota bacterium]